MNYIALAARTASPPEEAEPRMITRKNLVALYALLNEVQNLGNLADQYKRAVFYGKGDVNHLATMAKLPNDAMAEAKKSLQWTDTINLVHASVGMVSEACEFAHQVLKCVFDGQTRDETNLKEELGDECWYQAMAMRELETDFEQVQITNIAKLQARYPEKFNAGAAINRNLEKEREVLEAGK